MKLQTRKNSGLNEIRTHHLCGTAAGYQLSYQANWELILLSVHKGPGKRGHIVADTLLPTQMFPRLPARATFVADTNFESGTHILFLILFRNILCPEQMYPSLHSPRNIMSNNVSATMCPRLPVYTLTYSTRRCWRMQVNIERSLYLNCGEMYEDMFRIIAPIYKT